MFDERKKSILRAVILDYIQNAEPVGSRTLSRKYLVGISPATIRNEMSDLEDLGYLEQPHTSAGRIPSEKGYRFFVDWLMELKDVNQEDTKKMVRHFENKTKEIDQIIETTVKMISELTQYTSVALKPQLNKSSVKYIQILPIEEKKAIILMVTNTGIVKNTIIEMPKRLDRSDLERLSNLMLHHIKGVTLDKINNALTKRIQEEAFGNENLMEICFNILLSGVEAEEGNRLIIGGTPNILTLPEFKDIEKAQSFLALIEEKDLVKDILTESREGEIVIRIGSENKHPSAKELSVIMATYELNGKPLGSIGVLGPTRMNYPKVVSLLELVTTKLGIIIDEVYKE